MLQVLPHSSRLKRSAAKHAVVCLSWSVRSDFALALPAYSQFKPQKLLRAIRDVAWGEGSDVRALLAASIMGFAISREIGDADFEESRRRQLYDRLAAMLQACVSL